MNKFLVLLWKRTVLLLLGGPWQRFTVNVLVKMLVHVQNIYLGENPQWDCSDEVMKHYVSFLGLSQTCLRDLREQNFSLMYKGPIEIYCTRNVR